MKFTIITHVNHHREQNQYFAYAPYVREMNIWLKYTDEVIIVAPSNKIEKTTIDIAYNHNKITFRSVNEFDITNLKNTLKTVLNLPVLLYVIYKAMKQADHVHLRCPGNMGLLGCLVQVFFPRKKKTAKYAGNWDPKAKQPFSYKLQKWILSNTFLTKNMQVLVYGEWKNQTKNIKPFFTATYSENEFSTPLELTKKFSTFDFLYVGTLSPGKRPLYAIRLVENLFKKGINVRLQLFGEGQKRTELENYIQQNNLENIISLKGNQSKEAIKSAYQNSDFLVLPSKSEGWPKVVAEAMFWGCVPLASQVSCIPNMLDNGNRGILLTIDLDKDVKQTENTLNNLPEYLSKSEKSLSWSRQFTTEKFEDEIKKLL